MKPVNEIRMGGVDVLPLIEGGKGIGVSNGISSTTWSNVLMPNDGNVIGPDW